MKKIYFILVIIMGILLVTSCGKKIITETTEGSDLDTYLTGGDFERIEIKDGKTGEKIDIIEKENIKEFLSLLDNNKFHEVTSEKAVGYQFLINIGVDQILILSNKMIKINNKYYEATEKIPIEKIEEYLK